MKRDLKLGTWMLLVLNGLCAVCYLMLANLERVVALGGVVALLTKALPLVALGALGYVGWAFVGEVFDRIRIDGRDGRSGVLRSVAILLLGFMLSVFLWTPALESVLRR